MGIRKDPGTQHHRRVRGEKVNYTGHGGKQIIERVMGMDSEEKIQGMTIIPVKRETAHEVISLSYGFFTPLEGFMNGEEVEHVLKDMELPDGTLWSIPIVFDLSQEKLKQYGIGPGDTILLGYQDEPMAILKIDDIFQYDRKEMAEKIFGTGDPKHPGVRRTVSYENRFISGRVTLVNEPKFNEPFSRYWLTPKQHFDLFRKKKWDHIVAHQTRNAPHTGHETLMKQAWFAANEDMPVDSLRTGVLVNAIIGEKRVGDYIDESILLSQDILRTAGYFRNEVHSVTFTLWDMRYAGPREALFHAILRTNLGCTHHMFGRDHAGVGNFYGPYDAQDMLSQYRQKLAIKPVFLRENWYCPICNEVTNAGLCGHEKTGQEFSGTLIRSILTDGVRPTRRVMRPEVFDTIMGSADKYGFGSPFVTEEYLKSRQPIFSLKKMEVLKA